MDCDDIIFKDIAPDVITNRLINRAIDEQLPKGEIRRLALLDGIILREQNTLRLEFLNILRIDHLWMLSNLTKLSFSNNMIEKIENLDTLVNLIELDLSFNTIENIENLDNLIKLETLTLYCNKITKITNLHKLKQLHIFSIGKNLIAERENIFHLRKLKKLRSLNMADNECAYETNFRTFVATFLPQITYYEYKRINDEERNTGSESFKEQLREVNASEQQELELEAKEEAELAEAELHAESFVEFLGERQLFDSLFERDPDGRIILLIEEVEEFYQEYETNFLEQTRKLFEIGQQRYAERKVEVEQFYRSVNTAKEKNQKESQEKIEYFLLQKSGLVRDLKRYQAQHQSKSEEMIVIDFGKYNEGLQEFVRLFNDLVHETWKTAMELEMNQFDQLEETNLVFERNLTDMANSFIEEAQGVFTVCRSYEQYYMEQVSEAALNLHSLYEAHEVKNVPDELKLLLEDKELLNNAIAASHDIHMQLIDGREDHLVSRARQWLDNIVNNLAKNEILRNRSKVLEITHFLDSNREEFEFLIHEEIINADLSAALGQ